MMMGETPLHWAAMNGHLSICHLITDKVVKKNPKNKYNTTPLHLAANNGHLDICRLIMDQVEEKNPENDHGETPSGLAARRGHSDIMRLFSAGKTFQPRQDKCYIL